MNIDNNSLFGFFVRFVGNSWVSQKISRLKIQFMIKFAFIIITNAYHPFSHGLSNRTQFFFIKTWKLKFYHHFSIYYLQQTMKFICKSLQVVLVFHLLMCCIKISVHWIDGFSKYWMKILSRHLFWDSIARNSVPLSFPPNTVH